MNRAPCYDVPSFHRRLADEQLGHQAAEKVAADGDARVHGFSDAVMPELFHRLYSSAPREIPAEKRSPGATVRGKVHDMITELTEFRSLRRQTVADPMWSGMATIAIADSVQAHLPPALGGDADRAKAILDGMRQIPGIPEEKIREAERELERCTIATEAQAARVAADESTLRNALRRGIAQASEEIATCQAAFSQLGCNGISSPKVAIEVARRVRSSTKLAEIVEIAGRLTRIARAKRASVSNYARSEIVGVTRTGDPSRLLPSELGRLGVPALRADLFRRMHEKSALGYNIRGKQKLGKGPIIIAIDQSGSMAGDKDVWAKGVALALLDAARADKRAFGIILYATTVTAARLFPKSDAVDPAVILDLLSEAPNGGTGFDAPMLQARTWLRSGGEFRKADIVHITDGEADTAGANAHRKECDALGARTIGIGVGSDVRRDKLETWSHQVAFIDDVSRDAPALDLIFDGVLT